MERMARQIFAILLPVALLGGVGYYLSQQVHLDCDICSRHLHEESSYKIYLSSGKVLDACCPRCGLRFERSNDDVVSAEVADFITGEFVPADEALYVEGSLVRLCAHDLAQRDGMGMLYRLVWDRCLPSLLAFESRQQAELFRRQNGGEIKTYSHVIEEDM
jgi:hypothetical protein